MLDAGQGGWSINCTSRAKARSPSASLSASFVCARETGRSRLNEHVESQPSCRKPCNKTNVRNAAMPLRVPAVPQLSSTARVLEILTVSAARRRPALAP